MHVVCDIHMRRSQTSADSNQGTLAKETIGEFQEKHMEKGFLKKKRAELMDSVSGHCINHPVCFERPRTRWLVMCAMFTRGSNKSTQI